MANNGWETFLSYEDPEQDILIGLLRLRKCSPDTFRPELKSGCSIVRELHVYGSVVPVHARDPTKFQHQVYLYLFTFCTQTFWQKISLISFVLEVLRCFRFRKTWRCGMIATETTIHIDQDIYL